METDREFSSVVQLPQFPGPSTVTRHNASDDPDTSTAETVAVMRQAAIEDSNSPQVWKATQQALRGVKGGCRGAVCEAVYHWIASHVRFRSDDPVLHHILGLDNELDLLIRPARLLTMSRPAEDCDGFTMLACSMLLCAGVPCEIVTIKADHEDPTRFSHVYCQAELEDGRVLVMDCSQAAQHGFPIGWEAPEYFDRKTWGLLHPEKRSSGMHGLGSCLEWGFNGECSVDDGGFTPGTSPSGFDVNSFIRQITTGGLDLAKMAVMPVGYVKTPTTVANYGSGVSPALSLGAGGISGQTLLLAGLALAAVVVIAKK